MAPADQALILAPPGLFLVLSPGDQAGGAVDADRERRGLARLGGDQHESALHVLAAIIGFGGSGADVDQLPFGAAVDAVLGKADRLLGPGGDPLQIVPSPVVAPFLPKLGELCIQAGRRRWVP